MTEVATQSSPARTNSAKQELDRDRRDINRGSTLSILGFVARLCSRVPFLIIAGRLYGPYSYGEYVLLTAIVETLALVASFGLKRTLFRFVEPCPHLTATAIRHALAVVVAASGLLTLSIVLFSQPLLALFAANSAVGSLRLLALAIPLIALTDVFLSATLSRRIMRYEVTIRSIVEPLTLTVMSLLFFACGYQDSGLSYAFLCAFGLAACLSGWQCLHVFGPNILVGNLSRSLFLKILRGSYYTCAHDLARMLTSRIDTFAVAYFFPASTVGIYGMAQQFLTLVEKVGQSFYPMLMPVVSSAIRSGDKPRVISQLRSAAVRLVALQIPIVLVFILFGQTLLALFGPEFVEAWPALIVLAIGCWANASLQIVEIPLTYVRPHANVIGCLGGITVYFALILYVQDSFGLVGIAVTSVCSILIANICLATIFWRTDVHVSE